MSDLAIVHYHLNRGGVTQVIVNQLRALAAAAGDRSTRVSVLYGGRREAFPQGLPDELPQLSLELTELPALDYDDDRCRPRPSELADQIVRQLAARNFRPATTVVHVHNHNLGKNLSLPGAVSELARRGYRLLLQIHDFAEDFRPENYRRLRDGLAGGRGENLSEVLYPQAPSIHYAALNARDRRLLDAAGVLPDRLHGLPNPVAGAGRLPSRAAARRRLESRLGVAESRTYWLYPVRGIRRKNVGEAVLWSALAGPGHAFGLTLPPLNVVEQPRYRSWQACAGELRLPFVFEVGGARGLGYAENLAAADEVLTTSVAEGFGMVFLEPWLSGLPLAGRDLPEITADFRSAGIQLDALYSGLAVPLEQIDSRRLIAEWQVLIGQLAEAFGRTPPDEAALKEQVESRLADGLVDFAALGHHLQRLVVERAAREPRFRGRLIERNPRVEAVLSEDRRASAEARAARKSVIEHNAEIVRRRYSLEASGARLWQVYAALERSDPTDSFDPPLRGDRILDALLDPRRLHPVRIES